MFAPRPSSLLAQCNDSLRRIHRSLPISPVSLRDKLLGHVYTLYLFTRSDIKTLLVPTLLYGTAAAPGHLPLSQLGLRLLWIWLHLLQFCMANQCVGQEEDAANKPWRPIPSRRMTASAAWQLRCAMLVPCLLLSAKCNVPLASTALIIATLAYNELGLDVHWVPRHVCNALGYAAFNAGATYVGCTGNLCIPESSISAAQLINALVVLTTIHTPDFEDMDGDRLVGRKTLPVLFPRASRIATLGILVAWSIFIVAFWGTGVVLSATLIGLAALVGARFVAYNNSETDRVSFRLYTLWLCTVQIVPFLVKS
ncbi:hypothetical protein K466DRAFT_594750 [Polyporus arcularius HHB13444]|uniref:UbiA prenyltransferase n=1 Tax=Polyporus arcularius HHB13444 TaxID=1314778 RepID=A0A5C3PU38_9APHY|nr:hypothetical protein K466DRAFT_594750 [Polyporus arcularius HHB13444]